MRACLKTAKPRVPTPGQLSISCPALGKVGAGSLRNLYILPGRASGSPAKWSHLLSFKITVPMSKPEETATRQCSTCLRHGLMEPRLLELRGQWLGPLAGRSNSKIRNPGHHCILGYMRNRSLAARDDFKLAVLPRVNLTF